MFGCSDSNAAICDARTSPPRSAPGAKSSGTQSVSVIGASLISDAVRVGEGGVGDRAVDTGIEGVGVSMKVAAAGGCEVDFAAPHAASQRTIPTSQTLFHARIDAIIA